ncbi:hypothetical protein ABW636_00355 [Aquimarina sp. 2201CG1-2-11]
MNYLEKIDQLLAFTKDRKYRADFFDSNVTQEQVEQFYKMGYWDHILLGYNKNLGVFIAIRIVAHLPSDSWPIVYIERRINSVLMCSSLGALPMLKIIKLVGSRELFESFHKEVKEIKEIIKPVYDALNISESYTSYIDYLGNIDNTPKERKEYDLLDEKKKAVEKEYIRLYKKFDHSEAFDLFIDLVDKMRSDEHFVPEIPTRDYGTWTTRIYKMIGMRAYFDSSVTDIKNRTLCLWRSFIEPHAYDPQTPIPGYYPENSTDTHNFYNSILDEINYHKEEFADEIKKHPLFAVALGMKDGSVNAGMGFANAAAVIDEQYDDPVLVWKTLINTSYYTSSVEQHVLVANQAKALCERNGWQDTTKAVERNIKIYEDMK